MKYNLMRYILNSRLFGLLNHAERMPDHASSKAYSGYNCTAGFDLLPIGRGGGIPITPRQIQIWDVAADPEFLAIQHRMMCGK